jgi:hypothetical protein
MIYKSRVIGIVAMDHHHQVVSKRRHKLRGPSLKKYFLAYGLAVGGLDVVCPIRVALMSVALT